MPLFLICFPISLSVVHHCLLGCLGSSIWTSSQQRGTRDCFELCVWSVLSNLLRDLGFLIVGRYPSADSAKPSDPFVYLLGYRIREEGVIYISKMSSSSPSSGGHTDACGISLRPLLISVWPMFFWTVLCCQRGTWDPKEWLLPTQQPQEKFRKQHSNDCMGFTSCAT